MSKTYELFTGKELEIAELIQQRRFQILIHSCIYYHFNSNLISDKQFDSWARELAQLQIDYPEIASQVTYAEYFEGFDGTTGFDLPLENEWVMQKASQIMGKAKPKKKIERKGSPIEVKRKPGRLF